MNIFGENLVYINLSEYSRKHAIWVLNQIDFNKSAF